MKGYRFYLEYGSKANKRKGIHEGNVIALELDKQRPLYNTGGYAEAIAAVYPWTNSAVTSVAVSDSVLRDTCKRIPEHIARQIHPRLFDTLEQWERSANDVSRCTRMRHSRATGRRRTPVDAHVGRATTARG